MKRMISRLFNREQKRMAEEILDRNPGAVVLPPMLPEGGQLPPVSEMVPVFHVGDHGCRGVAFYYTHVLDRRRELPMATRAKYPNGSRPDRNQPMTCGSCGVKVDFFGELEWKSR